MLMISEGSTDRPKVVALLYVCMLKKKKSEVDHCDCFKLLFKAETCRDDKYAQLESNFNNDKKKENINAIWIRNVNNF